MVYSDIFTEVVLLGFITFGVKLAVKLSRRFPQPPVSTSAASLTWLGRLHNRNSFKIAENW